MIMSNLFHLPFEEFHAVVKLILVLNCKNVDASFRHKQRPLLSMTKPLLQNDKHWYQILDRDKQHKDYMGQLLMRCVSNFFVNSSTVENNFPTFAYTILKVVQSTIQADGRLNRLAL